MPIFFYFSPITGGETINRDVEYEEHAMKDLESNEEYMSLQPTLESTHSRELEGGVGEFEESV